MKGEIDKTEKLWYYDVPDWCIMFDELECEFFFIKNHSSGHKLILRDHPVFLNFGIKVM